MATLHASSTSPRSKQALGEHATVVSDVLFFSIGEGAIVVDERGMIARVNKVALDILGYSDKELLGKWFPEAIIAEDESGRPISTMERPITEVFLSGKPVFQKVFYRHKNGSLVPVALTVSPVMLKDKPIGAIELFRDITDELQLEHAKDEFISIASHQLRTPATVVKQYLGMILDGYVDSEEVRMKMIRTAYAHNNNQLDIINDLLKVAQIEANKLTVNYDETDIAGLLRDVIEAQKMEFKKRDISLEFKCPKQSVKVRMDVLHVQMVFENLISNANKYSNPGSTVRVEVAELPRAVTVRVRDEGIGIAPDDVEKLFNKFSRVENANTTAGGTGLGLYWAKKLVELYSGKISVKSKLDNGSTFSVTLPKEIHQ